jgi:hypothetical protein
VAQRFSGDRCGVNTKKAGWSRSLVRRAWRLIRIAITVEAFEAIARTLPLGSVGYENEANEKGERQTWLEAGMVDLLFLPRRRCYARHGVDRLREPTRRTCTSCFHVRLVQHGRAAMPKPPRPAICPLGQ